MEDKRIYTIAIVFGVIAIVLSLLAGALSGAVTGYLVARWQGRNLAEQLRGEATPQQPRIIFPPEGILPFRDNTPPAEELVAGALIREVVPDGPADKAGLREGDIIVAVNDEPVGPKTSLADLILKFKPGQTVEITYRRKGEERTIEVRLGENPKKPGTAYLGVTYVSITPIELKGQTN